MKPRPILRTTAIRLLDHRGADSRFGDIVETGRLNVGTDQKMKRNLVAGARNQRYLQLSSGAA
jgi:hypothetical protein